jgi:hypothetical protein
MPVNLLFGKISESLQFKVCSTASSLMLEIIQKIQHQKLLRLSWYEVNFFSNAVLFCIQEVREERALR